MVVVREDILLIFEYEGFGEEYTYEALVAHHFFQRGEAFRAEVSGLYALKRLEILRDIGQACFCRWYPFGGGVGDVVNADSGLPDALAIFEARALDDDAMVVLKDDESLPLVGGDDFFFFFGRGGQAVPGQVVFLIGEGEGEVAIHKGVYLEVFCGVDVGPPDGRVVVEVEVPEGFACQAGGYHI